MAIVNLQDLQVTFGAKTAVSAASFRVDAGETFSLIGASGCGKSTILRVLAGLQREWRGSVDLLGQAIGAGRPLSGRSAAQRADGVSGSVRLAASQPYPVAHPGGATCRSTASATLPRE